MRNVHPFPIPAQTSEKMLPTPPMVIAFCSLTKRLENYNLV
ncbi:hypothetical protein LINPERHAP1_LOCUS40447 [Linum perenne]